MVGGFMSATSLDLIRQLEAKLKASNDSFKSIRLDETLHDAYNSYYLQFEQQQLEEKILSDLYRQWPDLADFEEDLKKIVQQIIKDEGVM
jgi:biotin-(acetyl-CoA carboxylase) ligase